MKREVLFQKSNKLRICHIPGWYPTEKNPIAGIFIKEHIKASALYHDVVVIVAPTYKNKIRGFYQIDKNEEDGIQTIRIFYKNLPILRHSLLIRLYTLYKAYREVLAKGFLPDIVHAHEYSAGLLAIFLKKLYGVPVIVSEHSSEFPLGLVKRLKRLKAKFVFEHADIVCPVSENLRRAIERLGIKMNSRVIPNVVDTSLFFYSGQSLQRKSGKKKLLTVASLIPIKGIFYLLEALSLLREKRNDFTLDIVGDGHLKRDLEALARKLDIGDMVNFRGLKPKKEVAELMRDAHIFVLPSLQENMPCVLLEAMTSGLPIVATRVGGIPEIISPEIGVLVPPCDSIALADAINYMLDNLEEYQREKIAKQAKERFSYETIGKIFDDLYIGLLKKA